MNSIWATDKISLEVLNTLGENSMISHIGIKITEIGDNFLCGTMPVDERTFQPHKLMHGGASCVLAETLGSIAANFCIDYDKKYAVGQSIFTNHIRSAHSGLVTGKALPVHIGKTSHIWEIEILNEDKKVVSVTRLTMAIIEKN